MTPPGTSKARSKTPILGLVVGALALCSLPPIALAQDPIRVQTNQVLVPVVAIDKEQFLRLCKNIQSLYDAASLGKADAITSGVLVHDLTAADFQVFDDGKEQPIQNVTEETSLYWDVRDNRGHHTEYMGPGGGKWSTAEWPPGLVGDLAPPQHYVIAYTLPKSPERSCHQIKVKVNRPNALVAARGEYCNTMHSGRDPANGTRLGEQLEHILVSGKGSKVDISLTAIAFHPNSDAARVQIALDWPWESVKAQSGKDVLGMVFNKEGTLVTRFSDLAERNGVSDRDWRDWPNCDGHHYPDRYEMGVVESRYETQIKLPPGEYDLRVVVGDGKRFGRAEIPLVVEAFDGKALTMSPLSLCKQIVDVSAYGHESALAGAWTAKLPLSYVPLVSKGYEYKPTGNTRFKKDETVYTYFEVYEPLLAEHSPPEVEMQVRIVDATTDKIKTDSPPESAMQYVKEGSTTIPIGLGVDTRMLPKGSYRLEVQVTDSAGKSTPWRTATFTVE